MAGDFSTVRLGDVAEVRSGFAFKSSDMGTLGLPLIKIKNITPPRVDVQDVERVPEDVVKSIPRVDRYRLDHRDILIAMTGAPFGVACSSQRLATLPSDPIRPDLLWLHQSSTTTLLPFQKPRLKVFRVRERGCGDTRR